MPIYIFTVFLNKKCHFWGDPFYTIDILIGFWGELADWDAGVTCAQKSHDSGAEHVRSFSGGRSIFLNRNPYEAILSFHNFLYGGHIGHAPSANFRRPGTTGDLNKAQSIQTNLCYITQNGQISLRIKQDDGLERLSTGPNIQLSCWLFTTNSSKRIHFRSCVASCVSYGFRLTNEDLPAFRYRLTSLFFYFVIFLTKLKALISISDASI